MPTLEEKIAKLRDAYIVTLPGKIRDMHDLWLRCASAEEYSGLPELHRLAHSMAGTAGTYGRQDLGAVAKELEKHVEAGLNAKTAFDEDAAIKTNHLFDRLRDLCGIGEDAQDAISPFADIDPSIIRTEPLRVLLVDDDDQARALLRVVLEQLGHDVSDVNSGQAGVDMYHSLSPDLVLMDVVMPGMSGFEAAQKIKQDDGENFVPIIYLTAITDQVTLAKCIEAGGDDFLVKPYHPIILAAKIKAMQRIRSLYGLLQVYKDKNEQEIAAGKHMFSAVLQRGEEARDRVSAWTEAAEDFSGDAHFVSETPDGRLYVFLADFTGHGLSPAVGTILASEIFYSMAEKAENAREILEVINKKCNEILPLGKYCAGALIDISPDGEEIRIWNCGLPDVFLVNQQDCCITTVESNFMPLGILTNHEVDFEPVEVSGKDIAFILAYSDGVLDVTNRQEEPFSSRRLLESVARGCKAKDILSVVRKDVTEFTEGMLHIDDISLVQVKVQRDK